MNQRRTLQFSVMVSGLLWLLASSGTPAQAPTDPVTDAFYAAVRAGDVAKVRQLLDGGADVNLVERRGGATPLMNAAAFGSLETVRLLLDRGANINARSYGGATALMWAVNDLAKVRLLLDRGADVNLVSSTGRSALRLAAASDRSAPIVRLLLARGANARVVDSEKVTTVMAATAGNDTESIHLLVDAGGDVNAADVTGATPLMNAAGSGNLDAVKFLLAKGAAVNAVAGPPGFKVKNGTIALGRFTPLLLASTYGPDAVVKALLAAGADVNARDARGLTPLMLSVTADHGDPAVVRTLLSSGADVNVKSLDGESAMDWTLKSGTTARAAMLKAAGASGSAPSAPQHRSTAAPSARAAVERGLALAERSTATFFANGGCAACHAQNVTDFAVAEARLAGIRVDEAAAGARAAGASAQFSATATRLLEREDGPAVEIFLFALAGLAAHRHPADRATDAMLFNVAAQQAADGAWGHSLAIARPPMADGNVPSTALGVRALTAYGIPGRKVEMDERVSRAMAFLRSAKASTADDRAFRLLGLSWGGARSDELRGFIRETLDTQRADGGWAQRDEMATDAYATGLTLFALLRVGVPPSDGAITRAANYLVSTQRDDGSWYVRSRSPKFQPYFDGGFPHEHDQWISSMATGYATAALASSLHAGNARAATR